MTRLLAAAALIAAAGFASSALAQSSAPIPLDGQTVEMDAGTPIGGNATNLPGVGMDVSTSNRTDSPKGAGGLANGVGAYGVMTPDASGTAGNTLTRVPGAIPDTNSGLGIPLSTQGEPAN